MGGAGHGTWVSKPQTQEGKKLQGSMLGISRHRAAFGACPLCASGHPIRESSHSWDMHQPLRRQTDRQASMHASGDQSEFF